MENSPEIIYERSCRSRSISISVKPGGLVVVRYPFLSLQSSAERFVAGKSEWIRRMVARRKDSIALPKPTNKHFKENKETARQKITARIEYFASKYSFDWKSIRIGRQKSRWGSCSLHGTISFNYLLVFLPQELLDYVVVHELCHLKEHNHSKDFWNLVEKEMPEWKKHRRELRRYQAG